MKTKSHPVRRRASIVVILALSGSITAWVLSAGEPQAPEHQSPRLVAALQAPSQGSTSSATPSSDERPIRIDRPPVRSIEDPHAGYSAVAVDSIRDEIVLQDQNRELILVYDRLDNTPPGAAFTEPKRMIGGRQTKISANCGLYIDPVSGDIYSVNNDVGNTMNIFSREAKGDVPPMRELNTPHRTFGIAVDEEAQELFLTNQHPSAVLVWRKMAQGKEAPLRILQGGKTQLASVHGIALDTKNQLMYVVNRGAGSDVRRGMGFSGVPVTGEEDARTWGIPNIWPSWARYYRNRFVPGSGFFAPPSITVYPLKAKGNTPPLRVIQGPRTQLNWPAHIYMDVAHQELYVATAVGDAIQVFRATDSGNVAPVRVLKGPKTKLRYPHGVYVDEANQEMVVASFGNHSVLVYPRTAEGDTAPIRVIRDAPEGTLSSMFGQHIASMAYDTKRNEVIAPN
ncbi:MAG: hypothetical protein V3T65_04160 [Acidobacteriota bacterium]